MKGLAVTFVIELVIYVTYWRYRRLHFSMYK